MTNNSQHFFSKKDLYTHWLKSYHITFQQNAIWNQLESDQIWWNVTIEYAARNILK